MIKRTDKGGTVKAQVGRDERGMWSARIVARNGQPVWVTRGYQRKRDAVLAVESLLMAASDGRITTEIAE